MITRRRLLWSGVAVAASLGAWGFGRAGLEAKIASIVQKRLDFLQLDPVGVQAFAKDQATALIHKKLPSWNRLRYHFLSAVAPSFKRYYRSADVRSRSAKTADAFVITYLLSSDFFVNQADQSRVIKYLGFHDVYIPCGNPFARPAIDYPAAS